MMESSNHFLNLDNKKVLCLAETNYQFINCLNIACHAKNAIFDLYINEIYENSDQLIKRIKSLDVFDKVQMYNVNFNKVLKVFRFLFLKEYIIRIFEFFDYDVVLFASRNFIARCVVSYVKYYRPDIQLISYDEGIGTYTSFMESYTNSIEEFIIKIIYNGDANLITDKILYEPKAYIGKATGIKLYTMPKIDKNIMLKINYLFNFNEAMKIKNKYIYFDQYFDGNNETTKKVIKLLDKKTNNQLIIKKHPRTPDGEFSAGFVYQYPSLPYEVIAINDIDIENKVLITNCSTSVWTPMLLFGKFPRIVLLYPIFNNLNYKEAQEIIDKFVSLYDKNRVVVVKNYNELEKLKIV